MPDRDRFPVTDEAINALMRFNLRGVGLSINTAEVRNGLAAAAPYQVLAWIDALTDSDIVTLRFGNGPRFCEQLRAELRRLVERPS